MKAKDRQRDLLDFGDPVLIAALRHHLEASGWSRSELSRRTEINPSTISDWLRDRYGPGSEALRVICEAFGVSRSRFWARGEEIVDDLLREKTRRERAEELARLTLRRDAEGIADVLLELEPELRDQAVEIVLSRTSEEKAWTKQRS